MAELSTISRPYAEALFAAASADQSAVGNLDRWVVIVEQLGAVAHHPQVAQVVNDPKLSSEQVYALITGLLPEQLPPAAENFLQLVIENGRIATLPMVARQFRALKNKAEGKADCLIESALPLDDEQVRSLVWGLSKKFGLKLIPEVKVDPELIGGVRVTVGDTVLDDTIKDRLAQMKNALTA